MSTTTKTHFLRRDLLRIFALTVVLIIITGVLFYMDYTNGTLGTWAADFYRFLLRL